MKSASDVECHQKIPDIYHLCVYIPPLFSIGLDMQFKQSFAKYIDLANTLESGKNKGIMVYYSYCKKICEFFAQELIRKPFDNVIIEIRIFMLIYVMYKYGDKIEQAAKLKEQLFSKINKHRKLASSEELHWYYAYLLLQQPRLTNEELLNLIDCARNLIINKSHKKALYAKTIKALELASEYLSAEVWRQFSEVFSGLEPSGAKERGYLGTFAQARHKYILRTVLNKAYFEIQQLPVKQASLEKSYCLQIEKENIWFSAKTLFEFIAHIDVPSLPILQLSIPGKSSVEIEKFNGLLQKRMRSANICNTHGFLRIEQLGAATAISASRQVERRQKIRDILSYCLRTSFSEFAALSAEALQKYVETQFDLKTIETVQRQYEAIMEQRRLLSGLTGKLALALFYNCMSLGERATTSILDTVLTCFKITEQAKIISDEMVSTNKHKGWFDMADDLVEQHLCKGKNLLLAIGTPIKEDGPGYSTHAFYVVIKHIQSTPAVDQKFVQIMIINGGGGVARYHTAATFVCKNDIEQYKVVASSPLDLQQEKNKTLLKHYIYKAISLEYVTGINMDDENKDNPDTYQNLLDNIYLKNQEFTGYQYQSLSGLSKIDLDIYFPCQITGNCTIHNLKYAIKIMFNLDELQFGELLDGIIIGLDRFISTLLYRTEHKEIFRAAAQYARVSRLMGQIARTVANDAITEVFASRQLRTYIASLISWHSSFNSGQISAGFADRFETIHEQRTAITEYDFLTKIIQQPKL